MGNHFLINENNEEIGELINLLHINKNVKNKSAFNDISKNNKNKIININIADAKSRTASSEPNMHSKLNEDINRKKRQISERYKENNANFKSNNNKSFSKSIEIKRNSHSKVKESSSNNSFYKNQTQNNIHTNIVDRDFSNKSKEKIKNFKGLMNYSNQSNLNIVNDLKQKEKELKKQLEMNNNLKIQNNLLSEKNKKLEKNEENLKQIILKIQNELNQKQQELEIEKKSFVVSKLKIEELINTNNNYINQINYLNKEIKEKDNEINK